MCGRARGMMPGTTGGLVSRGLNEPPGLLNWSNGHRMRSGLRGTQCSDVCGVYTWRYSASSRREGPKL